MMAKLARSPLLFIILLAILLRVLSALWLGDTVVALPGTFDQLSYDTLARRLVTGEGFTFGQDWWPATRAGEPTAHWSYLYTLFLAGIYQLVGPHPLAARLVQAIIAGVLHPWLTYRIGRRVGGPTVGLFASAVSAVYVYFVYYAGALMTETFYILAILWALDRAFVIDASHPPQRVSRLNWLLLGLAFGVAVLLRQVFVLCVPFLFAWLLWRQRVSWSALRQTLLGLIVTGGVMAVLILPWTVHNYRNFSRLVPLNTNAGYALFWGNHPIYGTEFIPILSSEVYYNLIPPELLALDEAALDQALLREAVRFVLDDPGRYALLSLSRVKAYFEFWPSSESGLISNISRVFSFGLFLPLMLYGLYLSVTSRWRQETRRWLPLWGFVGLYSMIHLLTWALIRYRLPVDAVLMIFVGVACAELTQRLEGRWWMRQAGMPKFSLTGEGER